ncbi:MAG TPA: PIN domain-containing protein [bacterium]|nr:PIN domain-containing protein [bacterium]
MYLFDTNVFLEILLEQEKEQVCKKALGSINERQPGWITSFSLHAIQALMGNAKRCGALKTFLESCQENPHLFCYATTLEEDMEIAQLIPKLKLDFDDALQYYVARKQKLTLVTFDQDFQKVRDIQVVSPEAL